MWDSDTLPKPHEPRVVIDKEKPEDLEYFELRFTGKCSNCGKEVTYKNHPIRTMQTCSPWIYYEFHECSDCGGKVDITGGASPDALSVLMHDFNKHAQHALKSHEI